MMRIAAFLWGSALLVILACAVFWRPAPSAPPNSVSINYLPYPMAPAAPTGSVAAKKQDRLSAPLPKPKAATAAPAAPKSKGTWSRVVIIDGRRCYQPKGGGAITAQFCE